MMVTAMDEADDIGRSRFWRVLRIAGTSTGMVLGAGAVTGFLMAHQHEGGRDFDGAAAAVLVLLVAFTLLCAWQLVRDLRQNSGEAPPTRKERLNRNILVGSGVLGIGIAIVILMAGDGPSVLSNDPLPPAVALSLVLVIGVVAPAMSIYWHRNATDEQEAEAYKVGALYAISFFLIAAPVWWLLWRGGFAPEPDGIAIYFLTSTVITIVWFWKKYR